MEALLTAALYLVIYASVLVFAAASAVRAVRYARAPMHLRWEIYPIPQSRPARWRYMAVEIFFLKGLWAFNRPLWFRSFPFHFGLYLIAATLVLLFARAILGAPVAIASRVIGIAGLVLGVLGGVGLLARRLTDKKLRLYTTAGDIANLCFFIVTFSAIGTGCLSAGPSFPGVAAFASGLLSFDTNVQVPPLLAAGLALGALLLAYIPLTHMSHFIAKYFTYHAVRWDDRANAGGVEIGKLIAESLAYRPTWSASHIHADGVRSWAEVAAAEPGERPK